MSGRNDRRTIFGWAMCDWANPAYSTTIASALLPAYLADEVVPDGGYHIFGRALSGETMWGWSSASVPSCCSWHL